MIPKVLGLDVYPGVSLYIHTLVVLRGHLFPVNVRMTGLVAILGHTYKYVLRNSSNSLVTTIFELLFYHLLTPFLCSSIYLYLIVLFHLIYHFNWSPCKVVM